VHRFSIAAASNLASYTNGGAKMQQRSFSDAFPINSVENKDLVFDVVRPDLARKCAIA
jgi:hypothetical protein